MKKRYDYVKMRIDLIQVSQRMKEHMHENSKR